MKTPKQKKRGIQNTELPCTRCGLVKPVSDFYWKDRNDIYDYNCKSCLVEVRKKYNGTENMKRGRKRANLRDKYGLTIEEFDAMLEVQQGKCGVCEESFGAKRVCVDHNHSTGEVRALLCVSCNALLGHAKENRNILVKLANYIDRYN